MTDTQGKENSRTAYGPSLVAETMSLVGGLAWPAVAVFAVIWLGSSAAALLDRSVTAKGAGVEVSLSASTDARSVLAALLEEVRQVKGDPEADKKVKYLDGLLGRYQGFVNSLTTPTTTLDQLYQQGFRALLQKDYKLSKSIFDNLYATYPTTYDIYEIRNLILAEPANDDAWLQIYSVIGKDFAWRAPPVELGEMRSLAAHRTQ